MTVLERDTTTSKNDSHTDALTILVGVTGGIAAYKTVTLIRLLVQAGHTVHVIATEAALRFIGAPTFEAISRNPIHTDVYTDVAQVRHVSFASSADLIIIAPATANTIAKIAYGLADDLLSNTVLASTAPVVIAPAMHTEMWENPATVHNIDVLHRRGVHIVGPVVGALTGGDSGPGRMEEPENIVLSALDFWGAHRAQSRLGCDDVRGQALDDDAHGHDVLGREDIHGHDALREDALDLAGRRIVITAGGTREPFDPVRFLGNRSSGKQGVALAAAAVRRGAHVVFIAVNCEQSEELNNLVKHRCRLQGGGFVVEETGSVFVHHVSTTSELAEKVQISASDADIVIMAAAVADYRPVTVSDTKLKKKGKRIVVELVRTPDILKSLTANRRGRRVPGEKTPIIVGFAAETEPDDEKLVALGRSKRRQKDVDYLVVNRVGWNEGFSVDRNTVIMLDRSGTTIMEASGSKKTVADHILSVLGQHPVLTTSH